MKRFYVISAVLAVLFIALSVNFLPVRCAGCGRVLFRTSACAAMFDGCDAYFDECFANAPSAGPATPGLVAGRPAAEPQVDSETERPS